MNKKQMSINIIENLRPTSLYNKIERGSKKLYKLPKSRVNQKCLLYVGYEPRGLINRKKEGIDQVMGAQWFKRPPSLLQKFIGTNLMKLCFQNFIKTNIMDIIDVIGTIESTSSRNKELIEYIKELYPRKQYCPEVIQKQLRKNVSFELIDSEKSKKTTPLVKSYIKSINIYTPNTRFRISKTPASIRRYLQNFLKYNKKYNIKNKTILLCDDTIGEGITLSEAVKILYEMGAKGVYCYCTLRDFCR